MTASALPRSASPDAIHRVAWRVATQHPVAIVLLFALALVALNPIGYVGGDGDEYHYLAAARCAAEQGWCLPQDHWWRRWPVVAPIALAMRLFGQNQIAVALAPLAYALAALALFVTLVARQFGRAPALIAGLVLAATPIFSTLVTEPGIDLPEFAFMLAALLALQTALRTGSITWIVVSGIAIGVAVQARPTSLALLPILAGLLWVARRRGWIMPLAAGAALPSVIEAIVYRLWTGDALMPWKLSLGHNRIASSELMPGVDMTQSPLFNPAFIGGWRPAMGVHVHWTVDGLINLAINPALAMTLAAGLAMVVLERSRVMQDHAVLFALALAGLWFGALTYGFAIDPKPRMFLLLAGVASVCFGVLAHRRWPESRLLIAGAFALVIAKGVDAAWERPALHPQAAVAAKWLGEPQPGLSVAPRTGRFLTLVPAARGLPVFDGRTAQRRVLVIDEESCERAPDLGGTTGWRVERRFTQARREPAAIAYLRAHRLFLSAARQPVLCIMRR